MEIASTTPTLPLDQFLLLLRVALVAILYLVVLQVVGVARRDLRRLAVAPAGSTQGRPVVGHLIVVDAGSTPLLPGSQIGLEPVTSIGRAPTNTVVLESSYISTDHTHIVYRDRSLWVEDMGSKNGTTVNGQPVGRPVAVRPGDILQVGDVRFKFAV